MIWHFFENFEMDKKLEFMADVTVDAVVSVRAHTLLIFEKLDLDYPLFWFFIAPKN